MERKIKFRAWDKELNRWWYSKMNISSAVLDQECSPEGKKMEIIGNIYENPDLLTNK